MHEYKAKIIDVYDGDSITAIVDLGFHINITVKIRLAGIDTPEIRGDEREQGLISKQRVEELILNKEVILQTEKTGKYGRWLGTIYIPEYIESVNQLLLDEGLADPYE